MKTFNNIFLIKTCARRSNDCLIQLFLKFDLRLLTTVTKQRLKVHIQ
jgi:hypothetical protein